MTDDEALTLRTNRDQQAALTLARGAASSPLCPARHPPQGLAVCRLRAARRILSRMGTKSREMIYGASVRSAAERAAETRAPDRDRRPYFARANPGRIAPPNTSGSSF
jgi:hypothetical protein